MKIKNILQAFKYFAMSNFRLILSIIILLTAAAFYLCLYPATYRKLQFTAYTSKDLSVNSQINAKSFYNKLDLVSDTGYKYFNPVGKYTTSYIKAHIQLDTLNTSSRKQPYLESAFARITITLDESFRPHLKPGDEIALSVNGKVFPEKSVQSGGLFVMDISKAASGKIQVLLTISSNHFADSLWLKNSDDVIPIILKRISVPKCSNRQNLVIEMDSVSGKGRYVCVDKNSK